MNNYCKDPKGKWLRLISLDRLCENQRDDYLWQKNPKYRGRKISVSSIYRWYVDSGLPSAEAYKIAWKSQLIGFKPENIKRSGLNIDAKETLFLSND